MTSTELAWAKGYTVHMYKTRKKNQPLSIHASIRYYGEHLRGLSQEVSSVSAEVDWTDFSLDDKGRIFPEYSTLDGECRKINEMLRKDASLRVCAMRLSVSELNNLDSQEVTLTLWTTRVSDHTIPPLYLRPQYDCTNKQVSIVLFTESIG